MTDYTQLTTEELATLYGQLRHIMNAREEEHKSFMAASKDQLAPIEDALNAKMAADELKNIKTANGGLVYFVTKTRVNKEGSDEFLNYIRGADKWELLKAEPLKSEVVKFVNETGLVPPGLTYEVIKELAYRKS